MVAELAADGFKTVVIIDPGIKIDKEYSVYKEALEKIISVSVVPYMKGKFGLVNAIFQTILILKLENGGLDYLKN
jgi:alpha-glucosidase (family GH31 glycosyl hydrolase)